MSHWTPFYTGDYLRDTRHLSQGEHGAYLLLLAHYWETGQPLPLDEKVLFRIGSAHTRKEKDNILTILSQFFEKKVDGYHNKKSDEIIEARMAKKQVLSENGRKGGQANAKAIAEANAKQMPKQTDKHNQNQIQNSILPSEEFIDSPSAKVEISQNESEFLQWWETYPRKEAKKNARKAYWVARKTVSAETLLEGVSRYRASKPHYADWKVPTTWLNGEHWEDEDYKPGYTDAPTAAGNVPQGPTRLERLMASKYIQNTWDKQVLKVEDLRLDRHNQLWNRNEKLELTEYEPYEEEKAPC